MRNVMKQFGIITFIVIIGFAMFASLYLAGCDNGGGPNPNPGPVDPTGETKESAITLTENKWKNGNLPEGGGEQWFSFTATAVTHYIHFTQVIMSGNSVAGVYVQVYDNTDVAIGGRATLYGDTPFMNQTVTPGSVYYIKVTNYSLFNQGPYPYKITFNASSTPPPSITIPTSGVTTLTLNTWADGSFAAAYGEQWFTFTATAAEQYIHFNLGTLYLVFVQVYDNTGVAVGGTVQFNDSTLSTNRTVTTNSKYYIKLTPWGSVGTYKITFNASSTPPPSVEIPTTGVTTLTLNTWADGSIAANGEQWFKFTATTSPQYVHFQPGTLNDVYVQLYDNTGSAIGGRANLYGSTLSMNRTVTPGSVYHIKVTPYYSNTGSGAYKIAFNASSTAPGA